MPCCMQDLTSPATYQTQVSLQRKQRVLITGLPGKSDQKAVYLLQEIKITIQFSSVAQSCPTL